MSYRLNQTSLPPRVKVTVFDACVNTTGIVTVAEDPAYAGKQIAIRLDSLPGR